MSVIAPSIQPAAVDVEASLRSLVRRDLPPQRQQSDLTGGSGDEIKNFIRNLSGASIADVERTIEELAKVRDMLPTGHRLKAGQSVGPWIAFH